MNRREVIAGLGSSMAAAAWPLRAYSQRSVLPLIGYLNSTSPQSSAPLLTSFHRGLGETGFVEGRSATIEYRWAEGHYDHLPALAADLVRRNVDVIAMSGGDRSASAAKGATSTIPIVSVIGGDPVAEGLVNSLARPGGNLTGVAFLTAELMPKRLELLSELAPDARVVGMPLNPNNPQTEGVKRKAEEAAQAKGIQLHIVTAGTESEIDAAFATLARPSARGLVVQADPFFNSRREQLVALTSRQAIPAIYEWRGVAEAGGLVSYGASLAGVYRQVGMYVGAILKGAKPSELPIQQPTAIELTINVKTAKALGLTIPQSLLARADEVIE